MANLSTTLILKALDCLSARAEVTAQNIANANTPGYRPMRVSFEKALATAAAQGNSEVDALKPVIERDPTFALGADTRVDLQVVTASTTAARYEALIEVLNRQHQRDQLATAGNL